MKIRRSLLKDPVVVATYGGESAYGPTYSPEVRALVNVDATRRLVRNADGDEAVAEATLQAHPVIRLVDANDQPVGTVDPLELFAPESKVTLPGRTTPSTVLAAKPNTLRGRVVFVEITVG